MQRIFHRSEEEAVTRSEVTVQRDRAKMRVHKTENNVMESKQKKVKKNTVKNTNASRVKLERVVMPHGEPVSDYLKKQYELIGDRKIEVLRGQAAAWMTIFDCFIELKLRDRTRDITAIENVIEVLKRSAA